MNQNNTLTNQKPLLEDQVAHLQTREDFHSFLHNLLRDFKDNPKEWANDSLPSYLEALAGWVDDMDGYYQNCSEPVPIQPTWKTLGQILLAARVYE